MIAGAEALAALLESENGRNNEDNLNPEDALGETGSIPVVVRSGDEGVRAIVVSTTIGGVPGSGTEFRVRYMRTASRI